MFEATYNILAVVETNDQGQRLFKVFEQGEPLSDSEFSSLVTSTYQQEVFRTLRVGDSIKITMHLDIPPREIERTMRYRDDQQFEGDGLQQPTPDLLPTISMMYEQFSQQVIPGDVFRIVLQVQRP